MYFTLCTYFYCGDSYAAERIKIMLNKKHQTHWLLLNSNYEYNYYFRNRLIIFIIINVLEPREVVCEVCVGSEQESVNDEKVVLELSVVLVVCLVGRSEQKNRIGIALSCLSRQAHHRCAVIYT